MRDFRVWGRLPWLTRGKGAEAGGIRYMCLFVRQQRNEE